MLNKKNKVLSAGLLASLMLLGSVSTSFAYSTYLEIRDSDRYLGDDSATPLVGNKFEVFEIYLVGDGSENLNTFSFSIAYDANLLTLPGSVNTYFRLSDVEKDTGEFDFISGDPIYETQFKVGEFAYSYDDAKHSIEDITGSEPIDKQGTFMLNGEFLVAKLFLEPNAGVISGFLYEDVVTFISTSESLFDIGINDDIVPEFDNTGVDSVMRPSAVPIPGAIWLLGTGLVGLIGARRKKS